MLKFTYKQRRGRMEELFYNAFTGVNIIPTILLGLILLYWIIVLIGVVDLDLFDGDMELDASDNVEGFNAILAFFNVKEIPLMVILSILILCFWITAMLIYLLPIKPGGLINGVLLIPAAIVSIFITKLISNRLKGTFKKVYEEAISEEVAIIGQLVTLVCDVKGGRLGQGQIERDGASFLINVKPEFEEDTFSKNEEAYVTKKDDEKNIYYIVKLYIKK